MSSEGVSARELSEAFEIEWGLRAAPTVITCEHASERLPAPFEWPVEDQRLCGTHWAYDLGAREVAFELAARLRAPCVASRFTRLLVDPNREEHHKDLFRAVAEGATVRLNATLSEAERAERIARYYRPYHEAVDAVLAYADAPVLLSVHSFTPVYEGRVRELELGVLFNKEERAARALGRALSAEFPGVAYNEPWSGFEGLIYSAEHHAERHGRVALELEVRQDRALDPAYRARLVEVLAAHFAG